ncbi:MAG: hypothetical protein HOB98_19540 [Gammaproteobacteria bacterium]|nr:hypothetical protein [Gammaproteobacteria bacterium]MBT3867133.1 hypothetical protein [Gammaproteobacteria bacterium]MBT4378073.1 hypothetical protein [Gammaproteobacteria bacterium]MBT4618636.1 hypothetical protein [Gammaproteobacteria bacterium]MBT5198501.1 hypothetical protein [Gammaproteobacteria bacterium]
MVASLARSSRSHHRHHSGTFQYASNTPLFNSTGQPAISLPTHWTADGLPIGTQLAAGMGQEGLLLSLASNLESACDWKSRQSSLWS